MKIELWPIDKPIPYARNARKIPQAAIDKVAASIQEFGWRQPIVVDVRPGHRCRPCAPAGRKATRREEGPGSRRDRADSGTDQSVPADGQPQPSGERLGHGTARRRLAELQALNIDVSLTGFDAEEISKFLDPGSSDGKPPESFTEYDETIPTEHECPKCGYTWSGAAAPKPEATEEAA